jgi:hypothetical protein
MTLQPAHLASHTVAHDTLQVRDTKFTSIHSYVDRHNLQSSSLLVPCYLPKIHRLAISKVPHRVLATSEGVKLLQ